MTKQIERFRAMRREMEKTAELSVDKHEEWKRRASGPFWPILRRYVWLLDVCKQQAEYIEELNGIIEDLDAINDRVTK